MNHSIKILGTISIVLLFTLNACKKEEPDLPEVTTNYVRYVRRTSVLLDGSFILKETDTLYSYGFCWSTKNLPTINDDITSDGGAPDHFQASIHGLTPGTTYYARAYASNQDGTAYGTEMKFTTLPSSFTIKYNSNLKYETVTDINGNIYKTINIGTQTWMAENLRTNRFSDNSEIPLVADYDQWGNLATPGYCWYENNSELYKEIYGAYYNFYAVNTGKLCPSGWHVPSDEEWKTLERYLGMSKEDADSWALRGTSEGLKIKETGTGNWDQYENIDGTNESGFTGLPGGLRLSDHQSPFDGEGVVAYWWTSTKSLYNNSAPTRWEINFHPMITRDSRELTSGFNVRCIRD